MNKPLRYKRRDFLTTAAAAVAAPYLIPQNVLAAPNRKGANERILVGHIGFGGRARGLYKELDALRSRGEAESVAVCDVDQKRLDDAHKTAGEKAAAYRDYRRILDRKDIDAVVIGTPDHWHGVQFVHSALAGKHIYCEKPACCTIEESRRWWPRPPQRAWRRKSARKAVRSPRRT